MSVVWLGDGGQGSRDEGLCWPFALVVNSSTIEHEYMGYILQREARVAAPGSGGPCCLMALPSIAAYAKLLISRSVGKTGPAEEMRSLLALQRAERVSGWWSSCMASAVRGKAVPIGACWE